MKVVPGPSTGLVAAPAGVTTRLELSKHRARAGSNVRATLVVKNSTGTALDLTQLSPHKCKPAFNLQIFNRKVPAAAAGGSLIAIPCSPEPLMVQAGTTRFPLTVATTYGLCGGTGTIGGVAVPACESSGLPPAMPVGRYTTFLFGSGDLALPAPPAQSIELGR